MSRSQSKPNSSHLGRTTCATSIPKTQRLSRWQDRSHCNQSKHLCHIQASQPVPFVGCAGLRDIASSIAFHRRLFTHKPLSLPRADHPSTPSSHQNQLSPHTQTQWAGIPSLPPHGAALHTPAHHTLRRVAITVRHRATSALHATTTCSISTKSCSIS